MGEIAEVVTNKFGSSRMYTVDAIINRNKANGYEYSTSPMKGVYFVSTACLSVTSDLQSFIASLGKDAESVVINKNDLNEHYNARSEFAIVVAGCQVTDLAILNDIKVMEELHTKYPNATIFCGGCLAYRIDIDLPEFVKRIKTIRSEYTPITQESKAMVDWRDPYWKSKNNIDKYGNKDINLFRKNYPLKVGAGCSGKCKYCTINETRGERYETDAYLQIQEFLDNADDKNGLVIVSDSPSAEQIKDWCHISERYNKPISFRNVEPFVALSVKNELLELAKKGLLNTFHCPIQSNNYRVLTAMNRDVNSTLNYIEFAQELRKEHVWVATNIIIDYKVDEDVVHNMSIEWLNKNFDSWTWNPYFDGKWNREKAEERYDKYINKTKDKNKSNLSVKDYVAFGTKLVKKGAEIALDALRKL